MLGGCYPSAFDCDPGPGVARLDPADTDTFIAICEDSGAFVDVHGFESTSSSRSVGVGLARDATSRAYVTGTFSAPAVMTEKGRAFAATRA